MKRKMLAGTTSVSLGVFVQDTSSTTGAGLAITHASSGLVFEYRRQGQSAWTSVTPVTATLGTFTSGGVIADGALTGAIEIGVPDAALAASARFCLVRLRGVSNMLPVLIEIELDAVNYQDATAFGLSRIDGTITSRMASYTQPTGFLAATFPTTVASTTNITAASGITVSTNNDKTGYSLTATTGLGNQTANITGNLSGSVGSVTSGVTVTTNNDKTGYTASTVSDKTGYALTATTGLGNQTADITGTVSTVTTLTNLPSIPANWLTAAGIASGAFTSAKFAAGAFDAVWSVAARTLTAISDSSGITTLLTRIVGTLASGTHNAQSGDSFARLGAPAGASVSADILATRVAAEDARDAANDAASFANDASSKIPVLRYGTAQAGASTTITLDAGASSITDYYVGLAVAITSGTGAGQIRTITAYNGTTKVATVGTAWTTNPASGSLFSIVQAASSGGGGSGDASQATLLLVKAKTDLITLGNVTTSLPVTSAGQITGPLFIGDDYLNANGRAFAWTVALPSGYSAATSTCRFGMAYQDDSGSYAFNVTGIVVDVGSGNVTLRFDVSKATTSTLGAGWYRWSVEHVAADGTEITRIANADSRLVEWRVKAT